MKERIAKQGTDVAPARRRASAQWLRIEKARWAKVVKESGEKFE